MSIYIIYIYFLRYR